MIHLSEQHLAVRMLYKVASQLLDNASDLTMGIGRELNRFRAEECLALAEKIADLEPVKITTDLPTSLEVEGIPFDVGFVVEAKADTPDTKVADE